MLKNTDILKIHFSNNLFWDVDVNLLDIDKNKRFIIQRAIEYGTINDWKIIKKYYGLSTIGREMQKVRHLDNISLSFISMATGIKKEDFRCYSTKQSLPRHWDF